MTTFDHQADSFSFEFGPGAIDPETTANVESLGTSVPQDEPQATEEASHGLRLPSFVPVEPVSLEETGLTESDLEALILKQLFTSGARSGREIATQLRLPFSMTNGLLGRLKNQLLVVYKGDAIAGDYVFELTPAGAEKASICMSMCTYCGAAPVGLDEYCESVVRQTLKNRAPGLEDLKQAYCDLSISSSMLGQVGQAIASGRSLFLYGSPGNGKTSIAERAMQALGDCVWIPRSLAVCGHVIRIYDANCHDAVEVPEALNASHDHRWILIRRPTVVVGGELDSHHLELTTNPVTGVSEAPIQLKSNCGCLVIDDYGRQRISHSDLLNRWIIPLEKGYDILKLPNGSCVQLPFEQLVVFATNLSPSELCDEAFLRRIPYKIEVYDPSEEEFKQLFSQRASRDGFECAEQVVDYLIERHFRRQGRKLRFSYAEDLLQQVRDFCRFHHQPKHIDQRKIDIAVLNFFGKF